MLSVSRKNRMMAAAKHTSCLLVLVLFCLTSIQPAVSALTPAQKDVFDSGIYYFDVEDISPVAGGCTIGAATGSIDRFLQVLAFQESGGNPRAQAGTSSASGKYQYITSTWRSSAGTYYRPALDYSRALFAPEAVQDAVAYIEYTVKFKTFENDIFKLAISHFLPEANTNPRLLDIVPSGNVLTPRQYADRLLGNIDKGIGSDIPLSYREAPEFETWLARVGGENDATGSSISTCGTTANTALAVQQCIENMALQEHPSRANYFRMPDAPNGEYDIYSSQARRYGSRALVCTLYTVALAYQQARNGDSRLRIGDLNAAGHKSHYRGIAVDLSGFGEIQSASHIASWKGTYSKEATIQLAQMFINTGILRNIWWCGPGSIDQGITSSDEALQEIRSYAGLGTSKKIEGNIKCISGHHDHFHVDISVDFELPRWTP